jgi:hypothetical protein
MKYKRGSISIKRIITSVFIIALLVSVSSIVYLVFTNWLSSAKQTTETLAGEMNESIYNQISSFLDIPALINETNQKIISNGILDLSEVEHRDQFFAGVLSSYNTEIYSFSFGEVNGEYYGAQEEIHGTTQ